MDWLCRCAQKEGKPSTQIIFHPAVYSRKLRTVRHKHNSNLHFSVGPNKPGCARCQVDAQT